MEKYKSNKKNVILYDYYYNIAKLIIIQLMDSVHEADEPGDVGICHEHNRVFECYCNNCYWYFISHLCSMICASCLMFGSHKGHDVCKVDEGAKDLRNAINHSAKEGK